MKPLFSFEEYLANKETCNPYVPPPVYQAQPVIPYEVIHNIQNQQTEMGNLMQQLLNTIKVLQTQNEHLVERVNQQDRLLSQIKEELNFVDSVMK